MFHLILAVFEWPNRLDFPLILNIQDGEPKFIIWKLQSWFFAKLFILYVLSGLDMKTVKLKLFKTISNVYYMPTPPLGRPTLKKQSGGICNHFKICKGSFFDFLSLSFEIMCKFVYLRKVTKTHGSVFSKLFYIFICHFKIAIKIKVQHTIILFQFL